MLSTQSIIHEDLKILFNLDYSENLGFSARDIKVFKNNQFIELTHINMDLVYRLVNEKETFINRYLLPPKITFNSKG